MLSSEYIAFNSIPLPTYLHIHPATSRRINPVTSTSLNQTYHSPPQRHPHNIQTSKMSFILRQSIRAARPVSIAVPARRTFANTSMRYLKESDRRELPISHSHFPWLDLGLLWWFWRAQRCICTSIHIMRAICMHAY